MTFLGATSQCSSVGWWAIISSLPYRITPTKSNHETSTMDWFREGFFYVDDFWRAEYFRCPMPRYWTEVNWKAHSVIMEKICAEKTKFSECRGNIDSISRHLLPPDTHCPTSNCASLSFDSPQTNHEAEVYLNKCYQMQHAGFTSRLILKGQKSLLNTITEQKI